MCSKKWPFGDGYPALNTIVNVSLAIILFMVLTVLIAITEGWLIK